MLLQGHEILAVAPTGSGKTLSFLLPVVVKLRGKDDTAGGPRAVIVSPTKELAQQSHRILKLLCKGVNTIRYGVAKRRSRRFAWLCFFFSRASSPVLVAREDASFSSLGDDANPEPSRD